METFVLKRLGLVFVLFLAVSCGYEVDELSSTPNTRATDLSPGDTFTFQQLFETPCDTVTIVGAYMGNDERNRLIGKAEVSMDGQGMFVLAAAFDAEGTRVAATRLARIPVDFDELGGQTVPCEETLEVAGETDGIPIRPTSAN